MTTDKNAAELARENEELRANTARLKADVEYWKETHDGQIAFTNLVIEERDALQSELTKALAGFAKLRDVARECERHASSFCGSIDGVEEHGGDDHEDPTCAIWHRLYYAMFDADQALAHQSAPAAKGDSQ